MALDQLETGTVARVHHVGGERAFRRRLMELGLVPGTPVERLGAGRGVDPLRFRVRDTVVALRRHDAQLVLVERP
ncbi:MAG: ferrous iron transport protein A [Alphaproteobacteria bacterium]|nr:ferrous iron transport protein A [Alphaproteobacteria bacterium]